MHFHTVINHYHYHFSLHELVKHEENGLIFHNEQELSQQLQVNIESAVVIKVSQS